MSQTSSDTTVWDDWNAGDEDPRARERVEMSFESVRLEKNSPPGVGFEAGSRSRSVSAQSGPATQSRGTAGAMGWI